MNTIFKGNEFLGRCYANPSVTELQSLPPKLVWHQISYDEEQGILRFVFLPKN